MQEKEQKAAAILAEAGAALAVNDYLTVARMYARLSPQSLDTVIVEAMAEAVKSAGHTELSMAALFAERSAELRKLTEVRLTEARQP